MAELPDGYPEQWETDALLKDGATVRVRPIRPDDAERMERFHSRQSQESIYFRYFRFRPKLSQSEVEFFTNVDYDRRMAFIALLGDEMVAVSRYEGANATPGTAEVAFFVDDAHHGRGLATLMLEYLAERARSKDITTFTASVLPENYRMLGVFKGAGFDVSTRFDDGAIAVTIGIGNPSLARDAIDAREQQSRSRAVERFFSPESIAIVGAGRRPGSIGHEFLRKILAGGFTGTVTAVNPHATEPILGAPTVASAADLGDPVDLAIIAVPAESVFEVVEDCIGNGVKAVLVLAAGFYDAGPDGAERLQALVRLVRDAGVRLVGPLSYGVVNTDDTVKLHAHFLDVQIPSGDIGVLSQSGPLGAAILNQFATYGLGVSTFLSAGTRADVSVYDVLQYWVGDDRTRTVALYLENFGNPRNIVGLARRISTRKPVISVRPADPDLAAVADSGGIVLVDQVSELVDQVRLMSSQPLPAGPSVVIVSNAASVARLAYSACVKAGLQIVEPGDTGAGGAIDDHSVLVDNADALTFARATDPAAFERAVVAAAVSASVDSVLLALVPTPALPADRLARIVADIDRAVDKPVVAVNLVGETNQIHRPPTFAYPEQAAQVLGRMTNYADWRRAHVDAPEPEQVACPEVAGAVAALLEDGDDRLVENYHPDAAALFDALALPIAPAELAGDEQQAAEVAERLGYPVALKESWREDRRAGEAGGTVLDIRHKQHLRRAFRRMGASGDRPMIVQGMHGTGPHLRICMRQSPRTGSHLLFGIGGLARRNLPFLGRLVLPADPVAVDRLLRSDIAGHLAGYDTEPVRSLVQRLSQIATAVPDIAEIDLNPLIVNHDGVIAVEAAVRLRRWPSNPLDAVRTL